MSLDAFTYTLVGLVLVLLVLILVGIVKAQQWKGTLLTEVRTSRSEMQRLIVDSTLEIVNALSLGPLNFQFPVVLGGPSIDAHHARLLLHLLQDRRPKHILE